MEIEYSNKLKKLHIPITDRWEVITYKNQGYTETEFNKSFQSLPPLATLFIGGT